MEYIGSKWEIQMNCMICILNVWSIGCERFCGIYSECMGNVRGNLQGMYCVMNGKIYGKFMVNVWGMEENFY